MIIDKEVIIKIGSRNLTYYDKKGYNVNYGDVVKIKIDDLYEKTTTEIRVKCDNCGSEKKMQYRLYNNNLKKYNLYYCNKCKHIKSKKTKLEIYGDENYNNYDKNRRTCLEKYGVEHYNKLEEFKNKIKNTKLEKYGTENYNNIEKCQNTKLLKYGDMNYNNITQNKKTCMNRYGQTNISNVPMFKEKSFDSRKKKLIELYKKYNLLYIDYENYVFICKCKKNHIFEIPKHIFYNRIKTTTNLCTVCNPIGFLFSEKENLLFEFIKENYDGEIIQNSRNIINPFEIDVYLPELKLAFEYNGLFWHSDKYRPKNYHLEKTNMCEDKGIKLFHIYEDDWLDKQNIVKSMVLNFIGKSTKLIARKCEIKEIIDNNIVKDFLINNHNQGFVGSSVKLGLFFNNELISLMTFGKIRKSMSKYPIEYSYEILRFCNKININVIGAENKLFNYFIKSYKPKEIIGYADMSWNIDNLYEKLNFNFIKKIPPKYYYIINNKKIQRYMFKKDKLVKEGFDRNKTEMEIMNERGIHKIYDSGNLKYQYNKT